MCGMGVKKEELIDQLLDIIDPFSFHPILKEAQQACYAGDWKGITHAVNKALKDTRILRMELVTSYLNDWARQANKFTARYGSK